MTDKEFLNWIYERLLYVHKEHANYDYMHRLRSIIDNLPQARDLVLGLEAAAKWVEKRLNDYVSEHGSYDPSTGVTEFPGNGDEYIYELEEIIEGILALRTSPPATPTEVKHD